MFKKESPSFIREGGRLKTCQTSSRFSSNVDEEDTSLKRLTSTVQTCFIIFCLHMDLSYLYLSLTFCVLPALKRADVGPDDLIHLCLDRALFCSGHVKRTVLPLYGFISISYNDPGSVFEISQGSRAISLGVCWRTWSVRNLRTEQPRRRLFETPLLFFYWTIFHLRDI